MFSPFRQIWLFEQQSSLVWHDSYIKEQVVPCTGIAAAVKTTKDDVLLFHIMLGSGMYIGDKTLGTRFEKQHD